MNINLHPLHLVANLQSPADEDIVDISTIIQCIFPSNMVLE